MNQRGKAMTAEHILIVEDEKKIAARLPGKDIIVTTYGVGYKFSLNI